ncbi:branched-chain amino acid aminotransferase [Rubripirellula tenax]|uniref:Branched-chain amino acid aminotransferase n=1 Tax=Rubripirellula tenax TaxID=2528015 RepID=A0A5C6FJP2_9BACT|nr:aminotransferase class IV [Rubripirellula tenax]TWU60833.1 branched-chain amino acid aminotransferase [Rubripirellula tenax]
MATSPLSRISFFSGNWIEHDRMVVSIDDIGFRQSVTVVERLRTYNQRPFQFEAHWKRWQSSLDALAIDDTPTREAMTSITDELLHRNRDWVNSNGDVGITWFATPGLMGTSPHERVPTIGIHLNPIDHDRNVAKQTIGQPLVITSVRQQPDDAWPRAIKVRCRLHYFRADQMAQAVDPHAVGVLIDDDGSVTDTSIANLAIVEGGSIVSPEADQVLASVSQAVVEQIAHEFNIAWRKERVRPDRITQADEVLLMGTDCGVWFANRVGTADIHGRRPGPVFQRISNHSIWNG